MDLNQYQQQQQQQSRMIPNMMPVPDGPGNNLMSPPMQNSMNNKFFGSGGNAGNGTKQENEFLVALQKGKPQQLGQSPHVMGQDVSQFGKMIPNTNKGIPGSTNNNNNNSNSNSNMLGTQLPPPPPPGLHPQGMLNISQQDNINGFNSGGNNHNNNNNNIESNNFGNGNFNEHLEGQGKQGPHQMLGGPPPPLSQHQQQQQQQSLPQLPLQSMPQIPIELQPQNLIRHMVKDVVASNLYKEFSLIRQLSEQFNYISVNVEFAGTLARPIGRFRGRSDYIYQTVRTNVDLLDVLKVGISISDEYGNKPDITVSTWQFHFKMDPETQMIPIETIELLQKTSTCADTLPQNLIDKGIESKEFSVLLVESGLILNPNVTWVTYGAGYDLAFLTHMMINTDMPNNKEDYINIVKQYFPNFYDLDLINKHLKSALILINKQKNGINLSNNNDNPNEDSNVPHQTIEMLAEELQIPHYPHHNTTGGQSLLIMTTFHILSKITNRRFPDGENFSVLKSKMFGISLENEPAV